MAGTTASIVFLALFCSIVAYLVYDVALSTIVLAWLILRETMTMATLGGGLMVLLGMYLAEIKNHNGRSS